MTPDRTSDSEQAALARYLLDDLSPAERDEVEDRFMTDPGYFSIYQEVERGLIHDYATGTMERSAANLFERNYLVTGERRRRVVIVQALLAVHAEQQSWRVGTMPVKKMVPALALLGLGIAGALLWIHRRPPAMPSTATSAARKNTTPLATAQGAPAGPVVAPAHPVVPSRKNSPAETQATQAVPSAPLQPGLPPPSSSASSQPPPSEPQAAASEHQSARVQPPPPAQSAEAHAAPPAESAPNSSVAPSSAPSTAQAQPPPPDTQPSEARLSPPPERPSEEAVSPPNESPPIAPNRALPSSAPSSITLAQDVAGPTIAEQLVAQYKLVKLGSDSSGATVLEEGTVLAIQKGGILGTPWGSPKSCPAKFTNDQLQPPGKACTMMRGTGGKHGFGVLTSHIPGSAAGDVNSSNTNTSDTRFFKVGEKVYPTKIAVDTKNERIVFSVVACDTCNETDPPTYYKSEVDFQFPQGFLETADVATIEGAISKVFSPSTSTPPARPAPFNDTQLMASNNVTQPAGPAVLEPSHPANARPGAPNAARPGTPNAAARPGTATTSRAAAHSPAPPPRPAARTTKPVSLPGGTTGEVSRRADGQVATVHTRARDGSEVTVSHTLRGPRTLLVSRNGRTIVAVGHGGYVQRPYLVRNGRTYVQRTYVAGGTTFVSVYRSYSYSGYCCYYGYAPAYYYHPAFYEWAYNPWPGPIYYGPAAWGWVGAPWYAYYGFTPYPAYATASLWLTDYLIAANLQTAYAAEVDAANAATAQANAAGAAAQPQAHASAAPPGGEASASAARPVVGGGQVLLSPEVKQMVADEVKRQLAAEQAAAVNPGQPASSAEVPDALNPAERTFVVSSSLDVTNVGGQECGLTPGDVVMRMTDTPDGNNNVSASVQSSKHSDCASGQIVAIGVQDLQEMHNQFREQIDAGLKVLAENSGRNGLPRAPDTAMIVGEIPLPAPNPGAAEELARARRTADQTEESIAQRNQGATEQMEHRPEPAVKKPTQAGSQHPEHAGPKPSQGPPRKPNSRPRN